MNGLPTVPNFNGTQVFDILAGDLRERKHQQVKHSHRLANIFVTVCERNPCFEKFSRPVPSSAYESLAFTVPLVQVYRQLRYDQVRHEVHKDLPIFSQKPLFMDYDPHLWV